MLRFQYSLFTRLSIIRYASTKSTHIDKSTPVLRHNWLDISTDNFPTELSTTPDSHFNNRLIQYLSSLLKTPISANTHQHLLNTFQKWSPKEFFELTSLLGTYGLQPVDVICFLTNVPSGDKSILLNENLKICFENLLKLKFDTTTRSVLISNDPNIIRYDLNYLCERFDALKCYFTKREVTKLVRTHKQLFTENWSDLDYKINYLKIMLFSSTRDIVESGALAFPIEHIRQRYLFVYRSGLFKRVRREEQYVKQREFNISLVDIFQTSLSTFLKRTTNNLLRKDDYQAFIDSLKHEVFDNEFDRYLTLHNNRKKWTSVQRISEKYERKHWMSELDMYNTLDDDQDNEEDEEKEEEENKNLIAVKDKQLVVGKTDDVSTNWHLLSDYNRDRHRTRKIRQNVDPNIRL